MMHHLTLIHTLLNLLVLRHTDTVVSHPCTIGGGVPRAAVGVVHFAAIGIADSPWW
jgi:hypothetical protein